MAAFRYLGVHTPTALPYLVAEGILPADPSEKSYTWETYDDGTLDGSGQEELVTTDYCVVYSTGDVIRKVFRFEVEEQKVQQAILTWFPSEEDAYNESRKRKRTSLESNESAATVQRSSKNKSLPTTSLTMRQKPGYGLQPPDRATTVKSQQPSPRNDQKRSRALVVFLKLQAHIYFVRGSSHVINLPFEVERAFPAPRGLILQRRVCLQDEVASTPLRPPAPQNSFLSPEALQLRKSGPSNAKTQQRKSAERGSGSSRASFALEDLLASAKPSKTEALPRHYSLTDPFSEMGLVVATAGQASSTRPSQSVSLRNSDPLGVNEEVLYVSPSHEIPDDPSSKRNPLILCVTGNHARKMYTVYGGVYMEARPLSAAMQKDFRTSSGSKTRRRSSFVPGTGATTPAVRPRDQARESLGAGLHPAQESSTYQTAEETFASQLDPDFDRARQPAKESRRVSSLMSRTDLSTNQDRSAFQDMASSHAAGTTTHGRRAPSLGAATSRTSLGGRKSYARASTPGGLLPRASIGYSSDEETNGEPKLSKLSIRGGDEIFETPPGGFAIPPLSETFDGLHKEFFLRKITEIAMDKPGSFSAWTKVEHLHKPRIFTSCEPQSVKSATEDVRTLCLHIVQSHTHDHLEMVFSVHGLPAAPGSSPQTSFVPVFKRHVWHEKQLDAIKFVEAGISQTISLQKNSSSKPFLRLRSCTTSNVLDLAIPDLDFNDLSIAPDRPPHGGMPAADWPGKESHVPGELSSLSHAACRSTFDLVESNGRRHRIKLRLSPQNDYVRTVLDTCRLVLPEPVGDTIQMCWWHICSQLPQSERNREWLALMTVLLSLSAGRVAPPTTHKRSKSRPASVARPRRSGAGASAGATEDVLQRVYGKMAEYSGAQVCHSPAWSWCFKSIANDSPRMSAPFIRRSDVIVSCIARARAFLASTLGSSLLSPFYDRGHAGEHDVPRLLVALHLLREEQKLNVLCSDRLGGGAFDLGPVLAQLGQWLGWTSWSYAEGGFYSLEGAGQRSFEYEQNSIDGYPSASPPPKDGPPSVLDWISANVGSSAVRACHPFLSLTHIFMRKGDLEAAVSAPRALKKLVNRLTPRTTALSQYFKRLGGGNCPPAQRIELMSQCSIDKLMIETLPQSAAAPLQNALVQCQANPPTTWNHSLLQLVGRTDLTRLTEMDRDIVKDLPSASAHVHVHRDVHTICHAADQPEPTNFTSELERHRIAQLIFHEDRRYWEAEKLLNTLRPSVAECIPDPTWSDTEVLEAQKAVVQNVMVRTFSLAAGQSMFHYDSKRPLITEKFHIHGYSMSCVMRPMNITLSAERAQFTEDKFGWAWFHAGVSAGLGVSKHAEGIDTSWIVFNKPADLSNRHAGLLLGLGLNGHLRSIAKWLSFKYLTPKHTMTSIGLLLGLSVSFLGSMDTLVTRLLSVHITRMLPLGAAELNLSPLTQTTGLMGIGLLYYATQHRRMSEIMLSEIEYAESESTSEAPDTLRDESYRLAAGFALGFINLGKGRDLRGLHDMRVVERLLAVAVGSRPVHLVHILDQATAGAVIAVALIFMKTQDRSVAHKIDVPDTLPQFDYVRPDILLLRTMARHVIMWDDIEPTTNWVHRNLPAEFAALKLITEIKWLKSDHLPLYNILAGLLWSVSLKYAGSGSTEIRDFLIHYLDHFIRIAHLPAHRYDAKLTRNTVRNCQDLVALSCATVMAGTGDLAVFRRLRKLHGRVNADVAYGSHMAAHMALGLLFLGGGCYTLGTSNLAVASLVLSLYPLYPVDVTDNRSHLQAFRHFWVLAAEARCLVVRDVDSKRAISMPFTITRKDSRRSSVLEQRQAPTLLPPLSQIAQLTTHGAEHWPVTLDFAANPTHLAAFRSSQTVFVRRRPASACHSSTFSATLTALNDSQNARAGRVMWDWIFRLPVFADFEPSLQSLVVQPALVASSASSAGPGTADAGIGAHGAAAALDMGTTVVDDRLRLLRVAKEGSKADDLRDLKAVFAWAEREARLGNGRLAWLGNAVVDTLKALIDERGRAIVAQQDI